MSAQIETSLHVHGTRSPTVFRLQSSSCETECNFVCNCMYISMSYQYCMYEFAGPNPAGLRGEVARCRSVSSSSLSVCFTGIFRRHGAKSDFRRNIPIGSNPRYRTRYAQVGCSARARTSDLGSDEPVRMRAAGVAVCRRGRARGRRTARRPPSVYVCTIAAGCRALSRCASSPGQNCEQS